MWQPCCRSCSGIHSNNDELAAGSWCCTESELVSSPFPLQLTLNQFHLRQKVRNEICADSVQYRHIQSDIFPSSILLWNTLAVYSCQLQCTSWHFRNQAQQFSFHLSTGLRPVLIACTASFLSKVTVYFLLHGFLDTHLLIHSWCDTGRIRDGAVIGRSRRYFWRKQQQYSSSEKMPDKAWRKACP